jgi:hypothetical protein
MVSLLEGDQKLEETPLGIVLADWMILVLMATCLAKELVA